MKNRSELAEEEKEEGGGGTDELLILLLCSMRLELPATRVYI